MPRGRPRQTPDSPEERERAAEEIEARLRAGAKLRVGELQILFGVSRNAVINWLTNGTRWPGGKRLIIRYTLDPGGDRRAVPEDVLEVLEESRKVYSADNPPAGDIGADDPTSAGQSWSDVGASGASAPPRPEGEIDSEAPATTE